MHEVSNDTVGSSSIKWYNDMPSTAFCVPVEVDNAKHSVSSDNMMSRTMTNYKPQDAGMYTEHGTMDCHTVSSQDQQRTIVPSDITALSSVCKCPVDGSVEYIHAQYNQVYT